ncbi:hypothetical protein YC2023_079301 [Brassica napus]
MAALLWQLWTLCSFLSQCGFFSPVGDTPGLRVVLKLLLQAIAYCSWRERNLRIFQQTSSTEAGVKAQVHRLLRDRLISTQPPTPASTLLQWVSTNHVN